MILFILFYIRNTKLEKMSLLHPDFLIQYSDESLKEQLKEKDTSIEAIKKKVNLIEKKHREQILKFKKILKDNGLLDNDNNLIYEDPNDKNTLIIELFD